MVSLDSDAHDPEARLTALFEAFAVLAACVAGALGDLPLPGLAPRRTLRPLGGVPRWAVASAPAEDAASVPAA